MRGTGVASLATLERGTGGPYVSMITVATETDGTPLFLISNLALHTRNLQADPRASILFVAGNELQDPLALGRVSVMGHAEKAETGLARTRFLARHPEAEVYAGFADFAIWRLRVDKGHFVGGFGRIGTIAGDQLVRKDTALSAWEAEISRVLNDVNARYGSRLAQLAAQRGHKAGDWRLAACDPEGGELLSAGTAIRLVFAEPILDLAGIPQALERLAALHDARN